MSFTSLWFNYVQDPYCLGALGAAINLITKVNTYTNLALYTISAVNSKGFGVPFILSETGTASGHG